MLDHNTWNHLTRGKQLIKIWELLMLDHNIWNHLTVGKQMSNIKKNYSW